MMGMIEMWMFGSITSCVPNHMFLDLWRNIFEETGVLLHPARVHNPHMDPIVTTSMCNLGICIEGCFYRLWSKSCHTRGFTWVVASFRPLEIVSWHYSDSLRQMSHIWRHISALISICNVKIAQMRMIWHMIPWFEVKELIWEHVACHWLFHGEKVNIKKSAPHRRKKNHVYCHLDEGILDLGVVITTIAILLVRSLRNFDCAIKIWSHLTPFKESTCNIEGQVAQVDLVKAHCNLQE